MPEPLASQPVSDSSVTPAVAGRVGVERDFSGCTALVTGSSRNIGRAILLEFAARGANVIVNTRSSREEAEEVAEAARTLGVESAIVMGEPADQNVVEAIRSVAETRFGGVDIYVSNAARRLFKTFDETTHEDWHRYLNQQLTASWYLAKALTPRMRAKGWGRIVHVNGEDGWSGMATRIPHSTAKGGLRTLTKSLAAALGEYGITVNDVSPGFIDTDRDPATHPQVFDEVAVREAIRQIPIGRAATVEEVAWAVMFFCSARAGAITGAVIHVDGGAHRLG